MTASYSAFLRLVLGSFFPIIFLMVPLAIIPDLIRDSSLEGFPGGIWLLAPIFVPMLTGLIYVILVVTAWPAGAAMRFTRHRQASTSPFGRWLGYFPADQIARASILLRDGTITETEFAA